MATSCPTCGYNLLREGPATPVAIVCDPFDIVAGDGTGDTTATLFGQEFYRAVTTGVGYTAGDILRRVSALNTLTGIELGVISWFNVSTGLVVAPPIAIDINALDYYQVNLTSEIITIDNTVLGIPLTTIPTLANYAKVQVLDANIVLTLDGTTLPVGGATPIGFLQQARQIFTLEGRDDLVNFLAIREGVSNARIYVQYLTVYSGNNNYG